MHRSSENTRPRAERSPAGLATVKDVRDFGRRMQARFNRIDATIGCIPQLTVQMDILMQQQAAMQQSLAVLQQDVDAVLRTVQAQQARRGPGDMPGGQQQLEVGGDLG